MCLLFSSDRNILSLLSIGRHIPNYALCTSECVHYIHIYIYPCVIRWYGVHVSSCMIAGLVVLCVSSELHIENVCDCAAAKQACISGSSHQTAPEGAVRLQLFVYLALTCNYVSDRRHHVEKTYLAPLSSQSSKGGRCPV